MASEVKFLGLLLNTKLKWKSYITQMEMKAQDRLRPPHEKHGPSQLECPSDEVVEPLQSHRSIHLRIYAGAYNPGTIEN